MFATVEGASAVIVSHGRYKVAPVYERHGALYVKDGSFYIRLRANGQTSVDKCRVDELFIDGDLYVERASGALYNRQVPRSEMLSDQQRVRLLSGSKTLADGAV